MTYFCNASGPDRFLNSSAVTPILGATCSKKSTNGPAPVCIKSPILSLTSLNMSASLSCSMPTVLAPAAIRWNSVVDVPIRFDRFFISRAASAVLFVIATAPTAAAAAAAAPHFATSLTLSFNVPLRSESSPNILTTMPSAIVAKLH